MTEETTETHDQLPLADILKGPDRDPGTGRFTSRQPAPGDAPQPEPQVEAPEAPAAPAPQPSPEGAPQPQAEAKPGPSPVPENDPRDAEIKGLKAELARIRNRRPQDGQPKPEPQRPPSVLDDEEGFARHVTQNVDDMVFDRFLVMSEDMATERFKDFAEVMGTEGEGPEKVHTNWLDAIRREPSLWEQFRRASNPAAFAYQTLKRQKFMSEIGDDPNAYREKLRAQFRAEWEAERNGSQVTNGAPPTAPKPAAPPIPRSLAGTASMATREAPEDAGPKPLSDILSAAPFNRRG